MNHSESINELAAALAVAQGHMKPARMNATNPFLKNKYADLGAVMDACRDVLANNGLSFVQMAFTPPMDNFGPAVGVETMLMHKSGQWLSEQFVLPVGDEKGKSVMQVAGSAISYARRYALASMLGIVADEDTDGNAPAKVQKPAAQAAQPAQPATNGHTNGNGHKPVPVVQTTVAPEELFPEAASPEAIAIWRERLAKNPRPTVSTVCSTAVGTKMYAGEVHAFNAFKLAFPDMEHNSSTRLTPADALVIFDKLVARKTDPAMTAKEVELIVAADVEKDHLWD